MSNSVSEGDLVTSAEVPAPEIPQEPAMPAGEPTPSEVPVQPEPPAVEPQPTEAPTLPPSPVENPKDAAAPPPPAHEPTPAPPPPPQPVTDTSIKSRLGQAFEALRFRKRARLDKILVLAAKKSRIKNDDVEKLLRVSDSTAQRYLNQLVLEGKLRRSGPPQSAVYERV